MPLYLLALMLQGALGGADVIINHELLARLPQRTDTGEEETLHSARELVFTALFLALAWFEWHGMYAWCIAVLLLAEVIISMRDVVVEGDTRVLPVPERLLHLFMFMNVGVLLVLIGFLLRDWLALPSAIVPADHGWASWVLTALAVPAIGWAVRDGLSALRQARLAQ
jgi:hypothetical protein